MTAPGVSCSPSSSRARNRSIRAGIALPRRQSGFRGGSEAGKPGDILRPSPAPLLLPATAELRLQFNPLG